MAHSTTIPIEFIPGAFVSNQNSAECLLETQQQEPVYAAFCVAPKATIRAVWFSAASESDARSFCEVHELGFVGRANHHANGIREAAEILSIGEVMCRLKISRSSVYRLLRRGDLKRLRGLGAVRITRRSVDNYMKSGH